MNKGMTGWRWGMAVLVLAAAAAGCAGPRRGSGSRATGAAASPYRVPSLQASLPGAVAEGVNPDAYKLQVGDPVVIALRGIPNGDMMEDVIDEDGFVTMPFIGRVRAAERTAAELERVIRRTYVAQKIYKDVSVNVMVPIQYYFVRGEVRMAGRFPLAGKCTVVQAVAAAGGYTEYANPRSVQITRADKTTLEVDVKDMERRPEKAEEVKAGDVIIVPRSFF